MVDENKSHWGTLEVAYLSENILLPARLQGYLFLSIILVTLMVVGFILFVALGRITKPLTVFVKKLDLLQSNWPVDREQLMSLSSFHEGNREIEIILGVMTKSLHKIWTAERKSAENLKYKAIANTTQMLAHDIRKPFTLLKSGLFQLSSTNDVHKLKVQLTTITADVNKSLASVNGMIEDVMEVGKGSEVSLQQVSFYKVLDPTLDLLSQTSNRSLSISLEYDLKHTHLLKIDEQKVLRLFSNITSNAVQAMSKEGRGTLFFSSREKEGMIHFVIGNSGKKIPKGDLPKLFETFFTSGKRNGTGLGLAIAHKVVTNHGGTIWCESPGERFHVEFHFTLPCCDSLESSEYPLPRSLEELWQEREKAFAVVPATSSVSDDVYESSLYKSFSYAMKKRSWRVFVLDDNETYSHGVKNLASDDVFQKAVSVERFSCPYEFMAKALKEHPDILICDIDLGRADIDGTDVIKKLRSKGFVGSISVHSNRSVPHLVEELAGIKVEGFYPKPLNKGHFLRIICDTIPPDESELLPKNLPQIALIEDEALIRTHMIGVIQDATVEGFDFPESFLQKLKSDARYFSGLSAILLDENFESQSDWTGLRFAKYLRENYAEVPPLVLFSNGYFEKKDLEGVVDAAISKEPTSWKEIQTSLKGGVNLKGEPAPESEEARLTRHDILNHIGSIRLLISRLERGVLRRQLSPESLDFQTVLTELRTLYSPSRIDSLHEVLKQIQNAEANEEVSQKLTMELKSLVEKVFEEHRSDSKFYFKGNANAPSNSQEVAAPLKPEKVDPSKPSLLPRSECVAFLLKDAEAQEAMGRALAQEGAQVGTPENALVVYGDNPKDMAQFLRKKIQFVLAVPTSSREAEIKRILQALKACKTRKNRK